MVSQRNQSHRLHECLSATDQSPVVTAGHLYRRHHQCGRCHHQRAGDAERNCSSREATGSAIHLAGETASLLNVDYANSLSPVPIWTTLDSLTLANTSQFFFDLSPLPPQRFYRAWQTGTPAVAPSLDLKMVPAITATGSVGDSLRLDYINAIGPIDAWVTLGTMTLTNTPTFL